MKKKAFLFSIVCVVVILLSLPVSAEGKGRITMTSELENLSRGDLVAVNLELNRNPGVSSLLVTVHFDPEVLWVDNVQDLGLLPGHSNAVSAEDGELVLRWKTPEDAGDVNTTGNLVKIIFRVPMEAVLGETRIEAKVEDRFFDAHNEKGEAVSFETNGLDFELECLHVSPVTEVVTPPSFETAGIGKASCPDCGEVWDTQILPSMISEDGTTVGEFEAGQYLEEDRKGLRTDYLYGGAEYTEAVETFGENLIRAFRVSFTKNDSIFVPKGKSTIFLTVPFEIPEAFALYVLKDGKSERVQAEYVDGILRFAHSSGVFVLVSKETSLPSVTTTRPPVFVSSVPVSSRVLTEEEVKRNELILISAGAAAVLVFGTAAVILLRKGKRF